MRNSVIVRGTLKIIGGEVMGDLKAKHKSNLFLSFLFNVFLMTTIFKIQLTKREAMRASVKGDMDRKYHSTGLDGL